MNQDDLRKKTLDYMAAEGVSRTHICTKILSMTQGGFTMFLKGERQLGTAKEKLLRDFIAEKTKG